MTPHEFTDAIEINGTKTPTLFLFIGIPASGKSTLFRATGLRLRILSGDLPEGVPLPCVSFVLHDPPRPICLSPI